MKNIHKLLAIILAALLLLCGCGDKEPEIDYESLVVPPVDVSITDCITEEQVTSVMGVPLTLLGVYEDGTQAIYVSQDSTCQVTVNLKNQTREVFDSDISALGDAVAPATGVGEKTYWCGETSELLVYTNGYSLGVAVMLSDHGVDPTSYTRQIAELIVDRLQPTE